VIGAVALLPNMVTPEGESTVGKKRSEVDIIKSITGVMKAGWVAVAL